MRPAVFPSAVLALSVLLLAASPVSAKTPRVYRSLAVMDLETTGVSREEMLEIVDYLTMRIRETGNVRRVVNREEREKLMNRGAALQSNGRYEPDQLAAAARLKVDLIVVGIVSWNQQQYTLRLRLREVASGSTLMDEGRAVSTRGELLASCDYLAIRIAGAVVAPPPTTAQEKKREPLDWTAGFGVGQAGVSSGSSVSGGNYLYLRSSVMVNDFLGVSARYAFRLFPAVWDNHLLDVDLRLQLPPKKEVFFVMELGYLQSIDEEGRVSHLLGGRVVPVAGGEEEVTFELLPMALYFDLNTGEPVFMIELLAIEFLFRI